MHSLSRSLQRQSTQSQGSSRMHSLVSYAQALEQNRLTRSVVAVYRVVLSSGCCWCCDWRRSWRDDNWLHEHWRDLALLAHLERVDCARRRRSCCWRLTLAFLARDECCDFGFFLGAAGGFFVVYGHGRLGLLARELWGREHALHRLLRLRFVV